MLASGASPDLGGRGRTHVRMEGSRQSRWGKKAVAFFGLIVWQATSTGSEAAAFEAHW